MLEYTRQMADSAHECRTNLLPDYPSSEDAFGHETLADTLSNILLTTSGGKSIALVGSWGSGKSTVVELTKRKLKVQSNDKVNLFVFDAWAHQGDPLRRTFLERLLDFLHAAKWLPRDDYWVGKREELARRKETTTTDSTPVLTKFGLVFLISLAMLPFASSLAANNIVKYWPDLWYGIAGIGLLFVPFLIAAAAWFQHRRAAKSGGRAPLSLATLFVSRMQERVHTTKLQTPEPTSLEFQAFFVDAIEQALKEGDRKIVIVIDNLDRIDSDDALMIWATLQTFFDFNAYSDKGKLSRLWVVVPFDPSAVRKLWGNDVSAKWDGSLGEVPPAQSFLDKTFQIRLRVPRPVLSNWDRFFRAQLKIALPSHSDSEFHAVIRVFDVCVVQGGEPPTPRDIKLFINDVGVLHRRWQDTIPLATLALYIALTRKQRNLPSELANPTIKLIRNLHVKLFGDNWRRDLAAVHFNVSPDTAIQVLLGSTLNDIVERRDSEALKAIAEVPGVVRIIEQMVELKSADWAVTEPATLLNAVICFSALPDITDLGWVRTWSLLSEAAEQIESIPGADAGVGNAIAILLRRNSALDRHLIAALNESLLQPEQDVASQPIATEETALRWLRAISAACGDGSDALKFVRVNGTGSTYITIAEAVTSDASLERLAPFLIPTDGVEEVIGTLEGRAKNGSFDESCLSTVGVLRATGEDCGWPRLIASLGSRLRQNVSLPVEELHSVLRVIAQLVPIEADANQLIRDLASQGFLQHHLHTARSNRDCAALLVWCILLGAPDGSYQQILGSGTALGKTFYQDFLKNSGAQPEIVEDLASLAVSLQENDWLFGLNGGSRNERVGRRDAQIHRNVGAFADVVGTAHCRQAMAADQTGSWKPRFPQVLIGVHDEYRGAGDPYGSAF
jgi:energy-coupling factor transporter ATP-binding protein EcfA2